MSKLFGIKRLPANAAGRDFVMGDLHGEMHLLQQKLAEIAFDPATDRLFSVGDLVDRGTDSLSALMLLREPWFHAVCGNHEAMMVNYLLHHVGEQRWHDNGGDWHRKADKEEVLRLAILARDLPGVLIVGDDPARQFKVVHGEQLVPDARLDPDWDEATASLSMWTRTLHLQHANFCQTAGLDAPYGEVLQPDEIVLCDQLERYVPIQRGVGLTFCGHTSVRRPGLWRSHFLLDTGAGWWPDARLTVLAVSQATGIYWHWLELGSGEADINE